MVAALLPFVLIAVGLAWFFAYAAYSWTVRSVDPGLGDGWAVPLQHGYFFCMIDVTEHGYLMKGGCDGSPPVYEIRELAQVGDAVVGFSSHSGAFVLNTASGELTLLPDRATAVAQFSPPPELKTADQFYQSRRWGWQDAVALGILFGALGGVSWLWFSRFIRARSPAPAVA